LTRSQGRYRRAAFDQLRAEYLCADPRLHGERALYVWGAGRRTRKRASLLLERGIEIAAWIDIDPRKIGNRAQGLPVLAPQALAAARERPFVLVYVASHGARDEIGARLRGFGYRRGADYLMVG
jgi:hypothetical protein